MVNRWSDDDDSIGGFGLLEGEVPASQKKPAPSKRDARTRHQRPQQEWTPSDVAAEFSSQLYDRIRGIPGLINISKLAPILGKRRKDHGTNALIELEVLNMLMGDERRLADVKKEPHNAWRMYLKLLSTHGKQAIDNLGFDEEPGVDTVEASEYVYATDGKKFDNSMPGRKAMELYEEKLRRE